ncbi:SIMPL domain-containing protein [Blastomonas aquatica]|uniref:SIMPL domain-containing protein n=1 Tax=Blastomonas aquatica TaxID=1510276 RepID=A0ABQ1JRX4_9SPHN|nr:SIMPL domain-containing protein [Blastomonas aquatica]GGB73813.1 SIMPL domain-containing protein [Blastomonas aquatica]
MTKTFARALPLAFLATLAASPALAAVDVTPSAANPVVELSVTETVLGAPDTATFSTGVTSKAPTAQEALRANSADMEKVIAQIVALGIKRQDIQTSGINLSADYEYFNDGRQPRFIGYQVTNQVTVKVRQMARLGAILDAVVSKGANNISGPSFSLDDDATAQTEARDKAMQRAQAQAMDYAKRTGFTGVQLLAVSEAISNASPMGMRDMKRSSMEMVAAAPPIEGGQVGTSVTVNVTYQMTR